MATTTPTPNRSPVMPGDTGVDVLTPAQDPRTEPEPPRRDKDLPEQPDPNEVVEDA
jgi:hypothetical protein